MRLRTTLAGLLLVIGVVLAGTIYVGFALHKQEILAQERGEVETAARTVASDLADTLDERRGLVELWAHNSEMRGPSTASRRRALRAFVDGTTFDGGSVVAPNGTMVALYSEGTPRADELALIGQEFEDRRYVRAALNGSTYVSRPFEAESGTRLIAVSTPILNDGRLVGVFTGSFHLSAGSLFRDSAALAGEDHHVTVAVGGRPLYREIRDATVPSIDATAAVSGTNWTVTVQQSRADVAPQLRDATLLQFGAVLLALLSIGLLGAWVSRTTLRQIDRLDEGLDDLERGVYGRDLDLSVTDEWRSISDQFNALGDTLQQRESQLQVLNRVLRHNLRNDMNVVTAHAERVLAREDLPEEVAGDVEKIEATARRLLDTSEHARALYEDLLSEGERDPEPVDVVSVVTARVAALRDEFPECTIETDLPESAEVLDTRTLPIVVEELVHNAVVHNDKPESERRVEVTVRAEGDVVSIDVTDNGPGIPMVEEALLTDELEETPVEHGSGLGVWLVNWLVSQRGGTIEAHSGIGRGTRVRVDLPAAAA